MSFEGAVFKCKDCSKLMPVLETRFYMARSSLTTSYFCDSCWVAWKVRAKVERTDD